MTTRSGLMYTIILFLSLFALTAKAEIIVPDAVRDQITNDVMAQSGYYDAAEIEIRIREWKLEQPQPRASGELTGSGNCGTSCAQSGGNASLPMPRNVKFKGKVIDDKYTQNLIIKWKRPQALPDDSIYKLKHYKITVSKDGQTYEKYKVKTKFKNNGKPKKHQKLKLRGLETGDYTVQVRAYYKTTDSASAAKSTSLNKSSSLSSLWSESKSGGSKKGNITVGDIQSQSVNLYNCLTVSPHNFPDSTGIDTITSLQCPDKNLSDADLSIMIIKDIHCLRTSNQVLSGNLA